MVRISELGGVDPRGKVHTIFNFIAWKLLKFGSLPQLPLDRKWIIENYTWNQLGTPLGGCQFLEYLNSMQEAGVGLSVIGNRGIYKIPSAINHPGTWRTILKKPRQMKLFKEEGKRASSKVKQVAYLTGMRQGEILGLTWGQVDLREGFIRLQPGDTKTNEGRLVPFNGELREMFMALSRNLPAAKVFSRNGKPIASIREAFEAACRRAGIEEFTFHDLRHTAINNWRLRGHDYFRIMAATGHKTLNVFKRYNTVSKDELKALVGENQ